eukprot:CAMPEP_0119018278 /NCGR_PEP_ID=MMETSP1176-20130426/18966_1 /TAXON_ID=265551 /ORGANISM="Synedropsis recta cf, Strain CCMP1620" /LENGTH=111 /DNA_ID=CAMNT_0006972239 /DNA_START=26 /DNA_END=361 /DNA_ORIENTATION=-
MEDKSKDGPEEIEKTTVCPLFMDGLPQDFSSNPHLAALASLMNDDDDEQDKKPVKKPVEDVPMTKEGGGKFDRKARQRRKRQDSPYTKPPKKTSSASVAEAHLFLKMWNIN